jgi:hypothetical protein
MIRRAFHFLSSLSLLLLAAMAAICLSGVYLGNVWTVGWMATFTNRGGDLGVAVFVDATRDPTGRPLAPWKHTEVVRGNASPLTSGSGVTLAGLVAAPMTLAAPGPVGHVILIGWQWWSAALGLLPAVRLRLGTPTAHAQPAIERTLRRLRLRHACDSRALPGVRGRAG